VAVLAAVMGYFVGYAKHFREQKHRIYADALPVLARMVFKQSSTENPEYNRVIMMMWLYGSRAAAIAFDRVVEIKIVPERGDLIPALQAAVAAMRRDIQVWAWLPWKRIRAQEIKHLFIGVLDQ